MAKWSFSVHGVTRIITSNIYTRLAACNCISITFWSGDLPSPLMAIFDWFFFILAGNKDNHKISNGLEIRQDPTRDL